MQVVENYFGPLSDVTIYASTRIPLAHFTKFMSAKCCTVKHTYVLELRQKNTHTNFVSLKIIHSNAKNETRVGRDSLGRWPTKRIYCSALRLLRFKYMKYQGSGHFVRSLFRTFVGLCHKIHFAFR